MGGERGVGWGTVLRGRGGRQVGRDRRGSDRWGGGNCFKEGGTDSRWGEREGWGGELF